MPQPVLLVVLSELGLAKSKDELNESLNNTLANCNKKQENYAKVSTIIVVKDAFSVENGCLTPTLKVKRTALNDRYRDLLAGWHDHKDVVIFE